MRATVERKADAEKIEGMVSAMGKVVSQIRRIDGQLPEGSKRSEVMLVAIRQMCEDYNTSSAKWSRRMVVIRLMIRVPFTIFKDASMS